MEKKEWEALLDKANENLKKYGAELTVGKEKGDTYRIWVDQDFDIPQSINGIPIADCFEGLFFAG